MHPPTSDRATKRLTAMQCQTPQTQPGESVNCCVLQAGSGKSFLCKCSFIEIYNEQIFDLLDPASAGLLLREHIKKGVFVDGAVEQVLSSAAEACQVFLVTF